MSERYPRLSALGLDATHVPSDQLGRVIGEQRSQLTVALEQADVTAVLLGRLQRELESGDDTLRPAVGDWVALRAEQSPSDLRFIEGVLPRRSALARKASGRSVRAQVVAANVDYALVVCAVGRDVNERRIERFTTIAYDGGVAPLVLLNKIDTLAPDQLATYVARVQAVAPAVPILPISARTGEGVELLEPYLQTGRTVALLGTSGAGKTTLANRLASEARATSSIGVSGKGRHTTTSRELVLLPSGAALIDTPGLREVALWTGDEGLARAFEDVDAVASGCRFADCGHENEPGCAVREAVQSGELDAARVDSWQRLGREQAFVARQTDQAQQQGQKRNAKVMVKALRGRLKEKGR